MTTMKWNGMGTDIDHGLLGHVLQVGPPPRGHKVYYVQDVTIATQEVKCRDVQLLQHAQWNERKVIMCTHVVK